MRTYLLFLLVLAPSVVLGRNVTDRYNHFINQHVYQGMPWVGCDEVIRSRNITDGNQCKKINTFIKSEPNEIDSVCEEAGRPYKGMRVSNQRFSVKNCTLKNNNDYPPNCKYIENSATVYIIIQCEGDYPVHYEGNLTHLPGVTGTKSVKMY